MFPLKKHQNTTPSVEAIAIAKPVLSVESASLIDYAETLRERFGLNIFRQQLDTGLETQQLDNSEREAMMDRIKSTINDYDNKHPHTGPTHIYLLDGHGMGNADDGVVTALISSSMRNPSHTLAALIPENTTYTSPDDLSPSSMLKQLANRVLASEGVRCVVGKRALEAFLDGDEQYVVHGEAPAPSLEDLASHLGNDAVRKGLGIAVIGAAIYGAYRLIKGAIKNNRDKKERIAKIREAVHELRLRLGQVSKTMPAMKEGTVSSKDFQMYLTLHGHVPANVGAAATTYGHALTKFIEDYGKAVSEYIDEVARAIQTVSEKHASRSGASGSIMFGNAVNIQYTNGQSTPEQDLAMAIQAIKDPGERVSFPQNLALGGITWDSCKSGDWHKSREEAGAELPAMTVEQYKASAEGLDVLLGAFDASTHASDNITRAIERHERSWKAFKGVHQKWSESEEEVIDRYSNQKTTVTVRELDNEGAWQAVENLLNSSKVLDYDPSKRLYNLSMWTARSVEAIGKWMDRSVKGE